MKNNYSSYTEFYLKELFPSAIMFGMTEKEFWEDDPQLYWSYQTFYLKKKKMDIEENNYNAWLQGIYVLSALNQSLANNFSKKRKNDIYPKKPLSFDEDKKETKNLNKKEKEELMVKDFNKWARI